MTNLERQLENKLRIFYALKSKIDNCRVDTVIKRNMENDLCALSSQIEIIEIQVDNNLAKLKSRRVV